MRESIFLLSDSKCVCIVHKMSQVNFEVTHLAQRHGRRFPESELPLPESGHALAADGLCQPLAGVKIASRRKIHRDRQSAINQSEEEQGPDSHGKFLA